MLEWLKDAQNLNGIARDTDLFAKKVCAKEIFGSNLLLGEKTVRTAEGGAPNSFGKMEGNQWDALRASHLLALKKPFSSFVVLGGRLELPRVAPLVPKTSAYTNSAIPAICAPSRDRTCDILLKRELLYQLSYGRIYLFFKKQSARGGNRTHTS